LTRLRDFRGRLRTYDREKKNKEEGGKKKKGDPESLWTPATKIRKGLISIKLPAGAEGLTSAEKGGEGRKGTRDHKRGGRLMRQRRQKTC